MTAEGPGCIPRGHVFIILDAKHNRQRGICSRFSSSRKTNEVESRTSRLSRVLIFTIAAMVASSCTIHHTITFDDLSKDVLDAARDVRAAQIVESDMRYGPEGAWAVVVVGRDGFDSAAAVDDGLAEADAARVADLLKSLSGAQYLVGITPHSISYADIPDAATALQR